MTVLARFLTAMRRQVMEAVLISIKKCDIVMNSKAEWNGVRLPRITLEVGAGVRLDDYRGMEQHRRDPRTNSGPILPIQSQRKEGGGRKRDRELDTGNWDRWRQSVIPGDESVRDRSWKEGKKRRQEEKATLEPQEPGPSSEQHLPAKPGIDPQGHLGIPHPPKVSSPSSKKDDTPGNFYPGHLAQDTDSCHPVDRPGTESSCTSPGVPKAQGSSLLLGAWSLGLPAQQPATSRNLGMTLDAKGDGTGQEQEEESIGIHTSPKDDDSETGICTRCYTSQVFALEEKAGEEGAEEPNTGASNGGQESTRSASKGI